MNIELTDRARSAQELIDEGRAVEVERVLDRLDGDAYL